MLLVLCFVRKSDNFQPFLSKWMDGWMDVHMLGGGAKLTVFLRDFRVLRFRWRNGNVLSNLQQPTSGSHLRIAAPNERIFAVHVNRPRCHSQIHSRPSLSLFEDSRSTMPPPPRQHRVLSQQRQPPRRAKSTCRRACQSTPTGLTDCSSKPTRVSTVAR